jgi:hypothetical protein
MNVTLHIPGALRGAFEGRKRLELGVPPGADLGDMVETLLKLYPKLKGVMANEKKPATQQFSLFLGGAELAAGRKSRALREGQTLYLFASSPKRLSDPTLDEDGATG